MCVGYISSLYTVLTSPKKGETAVHCCDPALSVLVMMVSRNVSHVVPALQFIACLQLQFFWLIRSLVDPTLVYPDPASRVSFDLPRQTALAAFIVWTPLQFLVSPGQGGLTVTLARLCRLFSGYCLRLLSRNMHPFFYKNIGFPAEAEYSYFLRFLG